MAGSCFAPFQPPLTKRLGPLPGCCSNTEVNEHHDHHKSKALWVLNLLTWKRRGFCWTCWHSILVHLHRSMHAVTVSQAWSTSSEPPCSYWHWRPFQFYRRNLPAGRPMDACRWRWLVVTCCWRLRRHSTDRRTDGKNVLTSWDPLRASNWPRRRAENKFMLFHALWFLALLDFIPIEHPASCSASAEINLGLPPFLQLWQLATLGAGAIGSPRLSQRKEITWLDLNPLFYCRASFFFLSFSRFSITFGAYISRGGRSWTNKWIRVAME